MKKRLAIFDLDGTLINSLAEIEYIFNSVLPEHDVEPKKTSFYKKNIGNGIEDLLQKCLPKNHDLDFNKVLGDIRESYNTNVNKYATVFDGIYNVLDTFVKNNIKITVITNKPHKFAVGSVKFHFEGYKIDVIGAGNQFERKPDPTSSIHILKKHNMNPNEAIFVGDSIVDIRTAKSAKIASVGVLWGLGTRKQLESQNPNHIIKNPSDLLLITTLD